MKKTDFEIVQLLAQQYLGMVPVIILGSGASSAYGIPGMGPLADHIAQSINPSPQDNVKWEEFLNILPAKGLEGALTDVKFEDELTGQIVKTTRDFLLPYESATFFDLISNSKEIALTRLFTHFFRTTFTDVHVVTSNYDRLAEFAADIGQFACCTGFSHGYIRHRANDISIQRGKNKARTVCVWKVHGSLDWFITDDNRIFSLPLAHSTPSSCTPAMITPGVTKYQRAYEEPYRTIMSHTDSALQKANSYLCIGYGFNDDHIQTKLVEKCNLSSPIIVLARSLTKAARDILFNQRVKKFLALEQCDNDTIAYHKDCTSGVIIPNQNLWDLNEFLDMTIGAEL